MNFKVFNSETVIDEGFISEDEKEIRVQLEEYSKGRREEFNLDISFPHSFTGDVMKEMMNIPYGETRSYGEIAEALDSAAVAVGQACGRNPVPIIVPCHRVTSKNSLGGYSGGLALKKKLLDLEAS